MKHDTAKNTVPQVARYFMVGTQGISNYSNKMEPRRILNHFTELCQQNLSQSHENKIKRDEQDMKILVLI